MYSNGALLTVVMKPPVMSRATPRPASMSTRVAMIGWIPSTATRKPFHDPEHERDQRARRPIATSDRAEAVRVRPSRR